MKPVHIYIVAGLVAVAVIAAPFVKDAYDYAYPSGRMGYWLDACERDDPNFSRWNEGQRVLCRLKHER